MANRNSGGSRTGGLLLGLGIGALLMYFNDPASGRRRRALLRDQCVHAGRVAVDRKNKLVNDMRNRTYGVAARAQQKLSGAAEKMGEVIENRQQQAGASSQQTASI